MGYSKDQIISDIKEYIGKSGAKMWNEIYVGVGANALDRLFKAHGVSEQNDWWIFRQASSPAEAKEVETYFSKTLGAMGGSAVMDDTADYVYAYKRAHNTRP